MRSLSALVMLAVIHITVHRSIALVSAVPARTMRSISRKIAPRHPISAALRCPPEGEISTTTQCWVDRWVVANGLCPWASTVNRDSKLKITTLNSTKKSALQQMLRAEVADMLDATTATDSTLVVIPPLLNFDAFLDYVDMAEGFLKRTGMDADVQIATFHPDYQFQGTGASDLSNYTNRSPYPILHLLKVAQVADAISRVNGNTEFVWENNIRRLNNMGRDKVMQAHADIAGEKSNGVRG